MAVFSRFFPDSRTPAEDADAPVAMDTVEETKKDPTTSFANDAAESNGNDEPDSDQGISENAQHGVKNVEVVTQTWSKRSLITAFILYGPAPLPVDLHASS